MTINGNNASSSSFEVKTKFPEYPYLRDGIDVYLGKNNEVTFVFLSTRKRLQLKCHPGLIESLKWMRGRKSIVEIKRMFLDFYPNSGLPESAIEEYLHYLHRKNIIVDESWFEELGLPVHYRERLKRQLHFLMDMVDDASNVANIQHRILSTCVAVFGVGGVGGWIARELAMMGFHHFVLVDPDETEESDSARHAFADQGYVGLKKVDLVADGLRKIDSTISVKTKPTALNIDTNLEDYLEGVGLIVNTADEPYIGYTSIKLSRYAVKNNLPLFVAGGFDAHLASFGEMIIPRKTPCADCYANYFRISLADWKPVAHPVKNRDLGMGGWSPLSVISASTASLQILKYFINPDLVYKGQRTEFLAGDYETYTFEVKRDPHCKVCGD